MKKFFFCLFSLVIGLILFWLAFKNTEWSELREIFQYFSLERFVLVSFLFLIGFLMALIRWQIILSFNGCNKISWSILFRARAIGYALSYITPSVYFGGEPLRSLVLKEESKLDWTSILSSIAIDKAIDLTLNGLIILVGLIYTLTHFVLPEKLFWILISVLIFCLLLIYLFYSRVFASKSFFGFVFRLFNLDKIKEIKEVREYLTGIERIMIKFFQSFSLWPVLFFSFLSRGFYLAGCWLIINSLGASISFWVLIAFLSFLYTSFFFPLPGSLGAQEASQVLVFSLFGLSYYQGLSFALVLRVINLLAVLIGLLILIHFQFKMWGKKIVRSLEKIVNIFIK